MIHYKKNTENIVVLTLDMAGRTTNVLNHEIVDAFVPVIEHLKEEKARKALRGVILTSGKKTFSSGGDLDYLNKAHDPEEIFRFTEKLKTFFRDLERPGVPVVAAMNGAALGTGFELALACHHRIVVDHPSNRVGLPEVNMGLMPGGGGAIRLMWLLGLERAFQILTSGRSYTPQEALRAGIVDELAASESEMFEKARDWLMHNQEGRRPWDRKERSIPGGDSNHPAVADWVRHTAAELAGGPLHFFPAPRVILRTLFEGSLVSFDAASRIESRYYTQLLRSREAKNMIKAFWLDANAIEAGINRPKGYGKFRPKKVGIIGAGWMGSAIAFECARQGLSVVLKDVSKLIAERGRDYARQRLHTMLQAGNLMQAEADQLLERIRTTDSSVEFADCDLVIEAVFENAMVKGKVTREAETHLDEYSLFATNTISIPITELAAASSRPENYIGLHFFPPVEEVPLVEIVRGKKTSDESVARSIDFVRQIHKTPVVVKDDWGFFVARVQNTFILEGITMLQEGLPPALIENLGKQCGMPRGALALADDLSLDLVLRYERQAAAHYGPKYIRHPAVTVLETMTEALSRTGRNKRAGFYEYGDGEHRRLWQDLNLHFPVSAESWDAEQIKDRFLFAQVIEAVWCLQEGVINSIPEANLASIYGWGFPAFKGGVFQYIADYGKTAFLQQCKVLEQQHGPRFQAPKKVKEL